MQLNPGTLLGGRIWQIKAVNDFILAMDYDKRNS